MEDDDEFGDLYTDVLQPFSSSSSAPEPNPTTSHLFAPHPQPPPPLNSCSVAVDINISSSTNPLQFDQGGADDEDDILREGDDGGLSTDSNLRHNSVSFPAEDGALSLDLEASPPGSNPSDVARDPPLFEESFKPVEVSLKSNFPKEASSRSRVLEDDEDLNLGIVGTSSGDEGGAEDFGVEASTAEAGDGFEADLGSEAVIPGLEFDAGLPSSKGKENNQNFVGREEKDDDWDSDSEDDLQIVLNDNHHHPMATDRNTMEGSDDEDEDGEPLIIVADDDAIHPPNEEQGWGEDAGQAADGERRESAEAIKVNGGAGMAPKIGYGNHGFHPFHSQFKYVRPGATSMPGGAPGGAPGQVRPPANVAGGGRGRGDWRPGMKMHKGFHQGFWGTGGSGRGFGGEFTLPSHKTIFEVDIDSLEEKPWKYPGVDVSDFFNFGLNEESWKDYCKQLEQLRMDSTPQSKVHVLGGSRTEQAYDPDLPPELAAAAGIHDPAAENMNATKADVGSSDAAKGTARSRPPLPVGRPIPVETGSGERLPSVDTRPPRLRDSDAILEIVLQHSPENNSTAEDGVESLSNHDISGDDLRDDAVEGSSEQAGNEDSNGYPRDYAVKKKGDSDMRSPVSVHDEETRKSSLPAEADEYHPESEKSNSSYEERQTMVKDQVRTASMSPCKSSPKGSSHEEKLSEKKEMEETHGLSLEERVASEDEVSFPAKRNYRKGKEDSHLTCIVSSEILEDKGKLDNLKNQKLTYQADHETSEESDGGIDLKGKRSSDNSKEQESSDHQKRLDGADDGVIQGRQTKQGREPNRQQGEDVHGLRRREQEGSLESEKNYMLAKGREDSYHRRDRDPHAAHNSHGKPEVSDRKKERDYYMDGGSQCCDEDLHGRRFKAENPPRKHERPDEIVYRHRGQVRDNERVDRDEHSQPRKVLENGNRRGYLEKDAVSRHKEKEDTLKVVRHERVDDPYSKRRKDEDAVRRDRLDKEDNVHSLPKENTSRRKREREETLDHHSARHKDESLLQRERSERHRERDDRYRLKQSHDENVSKREREDGRVSNRSGRNLEEKGRIAHTRAKAEYKDAGRRNEHLKRKDRGDEDSNSLNRATEDAYKNQVGNDEKRQRQERSNNKNDRAVDVSELKPKDNIRKARDSEGGHRVHSGYSRKLNEERSFKCEMVDTVAGTSEQGVPGAEVSVELHNNRREAINASSEDEQQRGSKRGRSKLERWTSNNDRDYGVNTKLLKGKEGDKGNTLRSGYSTKQAVEKMDQSAKKSDVVGTIGGGHSITDGKGSGLPEGNTNNKNDAEASLKSTAIEDTVAKLKKRSERFKLPLPSDKDTTTIKKMEGEALPSSGQSEPGAVAAATEVKQERPARKRRWVSN